MDYQSDEVAVPEGQVEFCVPPKVNLSDIGSLIQLGIKFFLYQKGQISVPFESLHCAGSEKEPGNNATPCEVTPRPRSLQFGADLTETRQRLRFMRQEQMKIRLERKQLKRKRAQIKNEIRASTSLLDAFYTLSGLFKTIEELTKFCGNAAPTELAVTLTFGLNVVNPKECIIFKCTVPASHETDENDTMREDYDITKTSRQFYKSIIMCQHFGDFVCKRLRRTSAHLSLIISRPLPVDAVTKHSLSFVGNFQLPYPNNNSRSRMSTFLINLALPGADSTENNSSTWQRLNNHHCYRIPMSFKGMRQFRSDSLQLMKLNISNSNLWFCLCVVLTVYRVLLTWI